LLEDIKINLPEKLHKPAPKYFDKYGKNMEYAVFIEILRVYNLYFIFAQI